MPTTGSAELEVHGAELWHERELFLKVARVEAPSLLLDLRAAGRGSSEREVRTNFDAWQRGYFVDLDGNEWLRDIAGRALRLWRVDRQMARRLDLTFAYPSLPMTGAPPEGFQLERLAWHPELEKWEAFRSRCAAVFWKALDDYGSAQRSRFHEAGAVPGRVYRDEDRLDLVWLARYQFRDIPYTEVATVPKFRDRKTVQERVESAATRIGLTLHRPHKGGRPRNQEDCSPGAVGPSF